MKTYATVSALVLLFLLFGAPFVSAAVSQDYILGEGDLLKINVYDNPDLTTVARIGGDGMISFPLIGQVKVSGLTVITVSKKIEDLLSDGYLRAPHVSVFIEEYRSQRATIMGQVNKPGLYELKGYTTFLELLSKAGDLSKDAGDKAIIKRKTDQSGTGDGAITIDLKRLVGKGDTSLDIPVIDGDSIYVIKAGVFFVTGEVKSPGSHKVEEDTTVLKAITMAGGFTDKASTRRVKIVRTAGGKEQVLERVKLDEPVLPDDVIVVPESFF
ncbi:MAG: SLBB domain-containing protein [Nitrospirae bacterium]|nr:SLBB domain-containing protein [Nitrospirota bacterium]